MLSTVRIVSVRFDASLSILPVVLCFAKQNMATVFYSVQTDSEHGYHPCNYRTPCTGCQAMSHNMNNSKVADPWPVSFWTAGENL